LTPARTIVLPGLVARGAHSASRGQPGFAVLSVLVLLVVIGASSGIFIQFMHRYQARAGARYRAAAALAAAEAGVHEALSILETAAEGADGRGPRVVPGSRNAGSGALQWRYSFSTEHEDGGAVIVTSVGEAAGSTRRVRARAQLVSTALLSALHAQGMIRLERAPASTVILPYGGAMGDRPWAHLAAGRGIWLVTADVTLNDASAAVEVGAGPVDTPSAPGSGSKPLVIRPARLLLGPGADLMLDWNLRRIDVPRVRLNGVALDGAVLRTKVFPEIPVVDRAFYQARAAVNTANAGLNKAAGHYFGDGGLARKPDSLYAASEFERVLAYLGTGLAVPSLGGVVYVKAPVALSWGQTMTIVDGSLVAEGVVEIGQGAVLRITHTARARALPGVLVLDGGLAITQGARLAVHGLVSAAGLIEITDGGHLEVVGSVLAGDPDLSFHNFSASAVIRYDPAVLGTPGLRLPRGAPRVLWVASWEELE
jgi:hypothetical protein